MTDWAEVIRVEPLREGVSIKARLGSEEVEIKVSAGNIPTLIDALREHLGDRAERRGFDFEEDGERLKAFIRQGIRDGSLNFGC